MHFHINITLIFFISDNETVWILSLYVEPCAKTLIVIQAAVRYNADESSQQQTCILDVLLSIQINTVNIFNLVLKINKMQIVYLPKWVKFIS